MMTIEYFEIMDTNYADLQAWEEFEADMASNPYGEWNPTAEDFSAMERSLRG